MQRLKSERTTGIGHRTFLGSVSFSRVSVVNASGDACDHLTLILAGSRDGADGVVSGLNLVLVLVSVLIDLSVGTLSYHSPQKPTFPNSNSICIEDQPN